MKREYSFDIMRVISMICVIVIHVGAMDWYSLPITLYPWGVYNLADCLCRFCVPVFLMISGYIFLHPDNPLDVKKLYKKNIVRLLTAFFFWSFFYAIISSGFATQRVFTPEIVKKFIYDFFWGRYHMWYLYVILGLYISTPAMRPLAKDRKALKYFLVVSFLLAYVLPNIQMIHGIYYSAQFTNRLELSYIGGYTFYYLVGYYLATEDFTEKEIKIWYGIGAVGLLIVIVGTMATCMIEQYPDIRMHEYLTAGTAMYSCGAFLFMWNKFRNVNPDTKWMKVILWLSKLSFGVYLAHDFGLIIFKRIGFRPAAFNAFLSMPLITAADFVLTVAIAWGASKIPFLKKYIV